MSAAFKPSTKITFLFIFALCVASIWAFGLYLQRISYFEKEVGYAWSSSPSNFSSANDCRHNESTVADPKRESIVETYVIAMELSDYTDFEVRNNHSGLSSRYWQPAVDGSSQATLDRWARMIRKPPLNASLFKTMEDKIKYQSPHAVGCYMAHWHLIRNLANRPVSLRPDLYFVFENDAACIPNITEKTLEVARALPPDWDMLFVGGKPFTVFKNATKYNDSTPSTLRRDICRGGFGKGSAPLAPDGSRNLSTSQLYWKCLSLTNTHSYVVNPQRVDRLLQAIRPRYTVPIDILLQKLMQEGDLNVYMTSEIWCEQRNRPLEKPEPWRGFFGFDLKNVPVANYTSIHPALVSYNIWNDMILRECTAAF